MATVSDVRITKNQSQINILFTKFFCPQLSKKKAKNKNQDFCSLMRRVKSSSSNSSTTTTDMDAQMFDQRFLEENSEFFRIDQSQNFSLIVFHLDLLKSKANVTRIGKDLKNLKIMSELSANPFGFNKVGEEGGGGGTKKNGSSSSSSDMMKEIIKDSNVLLKSIDLLIDEKKSTLSFQVDFFEWSNSFE